MSAYRETRKFGTTWFEQGMERGMEQGMEQGMERGIEQGIEQGMERGMEKGQSLGRNQLARDVLQARFGTLDEASRARLEGLTPQQVTRIIALAFQADSPAQMWQLLDQEQTARQA